MPHTHTAPAKNSANASATEVIRHKSTFNQWKMLTTQSTPSLSNPKGVEQSSMTDSTTEQHHPPTSGSGKGATTRPRGQQDQTLSDTFL